MDGSPNDCALSPPLPFHHLYAPVHQPEDLKVQRLQRHTQLVAHLRHEGAVATARRDSLKDAQVQRCWSLSARGYAQRPEATRKCRGHALASRHIAVSGQLQTVRRQQQRRGVVSKGPKHRGTCQHVAAEAPNRG